MAPNGKDELDFLWNYTSDANGFALVFPNAIPRRKRQMIEAWGGFQHRLPGNTSPGYGLSPGIGSVTTQSGLGYLWGKNNASGIRGFGRPWRINLEYHNYHRSISEVIFVWERKLSDWHLLYI